MLISWSNQQFIRVWTGGMPTYINRWSSQRSPPSLSCFFHVFFPHLIPIWSQFSRLFSQPKKPSFGGFPMGFPAGSDAGPAAGAAGRAWGVERSMDWSFRRETNQKPECLSRFCDKYVFLPRFVCYQYVTKFLEPWHQSWMFACYFWMKRAAQRSMQTLLSG